MGNPYCEKANMLNLESRSAVIERAKKGKKNYEKRQSLIARIDDALKKAK